MAYPARFTEFFGPSTWKTLHCVAFTYAEDENKPTVSEKKDIIDFFRMWRKVLPCPACRDHYSRFLRKHPIDASTRDSLTRWLYALHSSVNRRINQTADGKKYPKRTPTYEEHYNDYAGYVPGVSNKEYEKMTHKEQMLKLADPHLGRPIAVGATERLEGTFGDSKKVMALGAMAGLLYGGYYAMTYDERKKQKK